jgi:hypothetical protein
VRSGGAWHTYRLPKGSYTYDPSHGWFTEWPRIREIGGGAFLLNMHGTFFDFPSTFAPGRSQGIRPLSTHLHYTTDFTEWNGRVVLAGDDTSILQNLLASKPQSNLRFITRAQLATDFGPSSGWGGVWVNDAVAAGQPSEPFLVAGYAERFLHLAHDQPAEVSFTIETDTTGSGEWRALKTVPVPEPGYLSLLLPRELEGDWLRVRIDRDAVVTAFLHVQTPRPASSSKAFASLASESGNDPWTGGLLRPAGFARVLQFLARPYGRSAAPGTEVYYEIDEQLRFTRVDSPEKIADLKKAAEPAIDYRVDDASVLITDAAGRRWRLPKSADPQDPAGRRGIREVVSERYLAQIHGTFYEIPRLETKTVPDFQRMKPVSTHRARIADFATWRGLLVLAGTRADATPDGHFFRASGPGGAGLWFGAIDDLYQLGVPSGEGGPWKDTQIAPGAPSDPYLMTNYGRKSIALSHDGADTVPFTIEVDFLANGSWRKYRTLDVPAGSPLVHAFPAGFAAHWVRVSAAHSGKATAVLRYEG